jgi:hypothetical protein
MVDALTGEILSTLTLTGTNGTLTLTVGVLESDVAFIIDVDA